jgi:autotransporter-associated beta strand protein
VKAGFIKGWDTPTNAVINFHGGTIVARESTDLSEGNNSNPASFMNDWNHAYVYSEGVKLLVEEGHTSTISQVFEDPTGKGLSQVSVSVSNGGSGYISPPLVTITGGGGNGATAYATLDSAGHVNGIVISNPGTDYTSAPTFTLLGGGGIDAAIAVDDTKFAQNVGGSLEKLGPGELTLTGASTRTGDTVVNDGTLNVTLGINTPNALVYVATGGTLNTPSIVADTLSIGGEPMGAAASAPAAVPEPGMFALLALAFLGLGAWLHVGRK